jgi:hypothetical protein
MAGLDLRTREAALKGGERGKAIVPGKPEESLLLRVVTGTAEPKMPPNGHLTLAEQTLLRRWIAAGAPWPGTEEKKPTWSALGPLRRPTPPTVQARWWVRSPVDAFVLAKLEANGLRPAPTASRQELIRRLTFDLTGLPPTPEEVARFEADRAPGAYAAVVDRLLASPRYGERWARRWLDIVRFAESQGFERDKIRDHAWPYRDYVIQAFNSDLPYDRFVREQIAGDVLPEVTRASIAATGMLVAGPYDEVGQTQASAVMRSRVREDELEDMVSVVGQTFLGLTVNCARCHDHKFDPIPQRDYFRFQAALVGVRPGDRSALSPAEEAARRTREMAFTADVQRAAMAMAALDEAAVKRISADPSTATAPRPLVRWSFESSKELAAPEWAEQVGGAELRSGRLVLPGSGSFARTVPLPYSLRAKTLEAWVSLATLDQRGGSVLTLEDEEAQTFDGLVFGERQPRKWIAGSEFFLRTQDVDGPAESALPGEQVHLAATYAEDGRVALFRNGVPYGVGYVSPPREGETLREFRSGKSSVRFGQRHKGAGGFFSGEIEEARVYDRALTPLEIQASFRAGPRAVSSVQLEAVRTPAERTEYQRVLAELSKAREELKNAAVGVRPQVYAANPTPPPPVRLLKRGDVTQPGKLLAPAGLSCLPESGADLGLSPDAPDAERRRRLAEWIVGPRNPLTPRVMANRVWQLLFGRGLVGSPSDFGVNGESPTHPELLDWLADTFRSPRTPTDSHAAAWSVKALVRTIVTSNAYKQSSRFNAGEARVDAENHLLWRKSPRRLEAEELRDATLAVSGQLNLAMGGPGFRPFTVLSSNSSFYTYQDRPEPEFNRRSIYRTVVNGGGSPLLEAFDCPDPSVKTPRRSNTVTPLQALAWMNNAFVLRQARETAQRIEKLAGETPERQVETAYRLAYSRPPLPAERSRAAEFVRAHGLAAFCRVLFNASEFLYVR